MRVPRQKADGLLRTLASDHVSALRNTGRGGCDIVLTNKNTSHMDFSDLSVLGAHDATELQVKQAFLSVVEAHTRAFFDEKLSGIPEPLIDSAAASGLVLSAARYQSVTAPLIGAGHEVRGLTRSDAGVEQLKAVGAEVHRGDLTDLDSLRSGATGMDAVVNLAFNHDDMSKFAQNAKDEIQAIEALGSVLAPGKLLVVTSGVGITSGAPGQVRKETDPPTDSPAMPRRPEQAAQAVAAKGVLVAIVRLPQVHDTRRQGLVTWVIQIAREKGLSAYVGDGENRWAAAPLKDVAHLYRLAVEKTGPGVTTYHAVQEEGVSLRDIAEAIGKGLKVPVVSIPAEKAGEHFGMFLGHAATRDMPGSNEWTRKTLGWDPTGPGLIEDLANMKY